MKERNLAGLPWNYTRIRSDCSKIILEFVYDAESDCEDGYPYVYDYDYSSIKQLVLRYIYIYI